MLSKIIINITEGDGMEDYDFSQVSVSIDGMSVTADLSLADKSLSNLGAVSPISPAVVSPGVSYQAIVLPQGKAAGRSVKFSFSDRDFTWPVPDSDEILAGKEYTWNLTVGKVGVTLSGATIGVWGPGQESNGSAD